MRWGMTIIGAWLCMCGYLIGAGAAGAQCYPGLACPDQGGSSAGTGGDGNAGGQSSAKAQGAGTQYYYVGPVFPPDPWLALRTVPSSSGGKTLMKMPQGTLFKVNEKRGKWWHVELRDGQAGWAHSDWIVCCKTLNE